ncbi:hypothetical protein [Peribacillus loiseleuriae]|uniref:Abortive phage infection protein n=1 Tax=Peribacillus loiseleuriae TaxID=1679170 RepID=A0A0K9GSM3_9BACI|nr:hypothetical protein [Peribacillus loiseleuriae]KMY49272.1 hypothetical protein AC625_06830 [Peribacillus loiseleuriae]
MEKEEVETLLNQLANREIDECTITKEHFLSFQLVLVNREDFKRFRGIAKHGGEVTYQYMDEPRS